MKRVLRITFFFILGFVLVISTGATAADDFSDSHVLVKFKKVPSPSRVKSFAASRGLQFDRAIPRIGVFRFSFPRGQNALNIVDKLNLDPFVEFAEPDYIRVAYFEPNDPLFGSQWDMTLIGMPSYWEFEKGDPGVVIAVLDTGIDLDHPDLMNQLWVNSDETPGNGIDDDLNGYVDDYNGYDFAGDGWFPGPGAEDPIPEDAYVGHGTHVSGTCAAEQDNNEGITGEAPGSKLMAVRVLGGLVGTGYSSDIAEGIIYVVDNGASVINMSLGGTAKSLTEYNALKHAWDNNVFIAAAAGNDGDGMNPISYPAAYVFTMSVGATDSLDNIASFSTHNEFVEVSAPGVTILSTVPGGTYESAMWSGTSMATPHVAGLAALLYSTYPGIRNWQVRSILQAGVIDRGVPGWDEFYGYGRTDAVRILATPPPSADLLDILSPPEGVAFRSTSLMALLWNPVTGAAGYRITASLPGGGTWSTLTANTYYTVPPSQPVPTGSYTVVVEALDGTGTVLGSDTVSFNRN